MNKYIILLYLLVFTSFNELNSNLVWGNIGHKVVGEIAERKLNPEVKNIVINLLNGESMSSASTWADEIKSDPNYKKYSPWHYVNMPLDSEYDNSKKNSQGDIIFALKHCIKTLKDPGSTKKEKSFYLKFLIHFVGDIHQPLHTGKFEDRGGNDIKLTFLGKQTNFHRVWDIHMIEYLKMDYMQLSDELMLMSNVSFSLNPEDWVFENHQDVKKLYTEIENISNVDEFYINEKIPFIKNKLFKAGSTLAGILNHIFS